MTRLQTQAEEFSSSTEESLVKLGIKSDMKVVDIGCGTGSVSFMISPMVGELGRVVGVDSNQYAINYCNEVARSNGILNAKFMISDATRSGF